MNIVTVSAILAGFAIGSCSASAQIEAREIVVADLVFSGYSKTGTPYPSYNISVPEDGVTVPITNPLIVYSISPVEAFTTHDSYYPQSNCTIILEDGTYAYVTGTYDIIPQKVVSVSCVAAQYPVTTYATSSTSSTATPSLTATTTSSPIVTTSSLIPPFPTPVPHPVPGTTGASASAGPSATGTIGGGSTVVPFTGDAVKNARSFGGSIVALIGLVAAL